MENKIEITNNTSDLKLDYDEKSPVTGNMCVILEADSDTGEEHRMCMESGYVTRSTLVLGSDACTEHEKGCSDLMKRLQMVDMNLNSVWYPTFMRMPGVMLYCDGGGAHPLDYNWRIATVVPIVGEERLKYPIPGKENEYYTSRLDTDNAKGFVQGDFASAIDYFYTVIAEAQERNDN